MKQRNVVVVSGLSGAGKTTVMSIFEDMNYLTIDNLPAPLLSDLVEMMENDTTDYYEKVVLGVNIMNLDDFLQRVNQSKLDTKVIMLVCSDEELLRRYKYNRRIHPLVQKGLAQSDLEAIALEQLETNRLAKPTNIVIDTTHLSKQQLIKKIEFHKEIKFDFTTTLIFESFGYRFGLPLDADYVFDVRYLDNPYWDKELRKKTGDDIEIQDYVHNDIKAQRFYESLVPLLNDVIDGAISMNRSSVTVAIGCTGGQHRSVVLTNDLYEFYKHNRFMSKLSQESDVRFNVVKFHRDREKNLEKILAEEKLKKG